jgi:hypothetical protein
MAIVDINWNPSRKELKAFSLLLIVFFAIVAWLAHQKGASVQTAWTIAGGGAAVGIAGLLAPAFIRVVYVVWMAAVFPIGFFVSNVVLRRCLANRHPDKADRPKRIAAWIRPRRKDLLECSATNDRSSAVLSAVLIRRQISHQQS